MCKSVRLCAHLYRMDVWLRVGGWAGGGMWLSRLWRVVDDVGYEVWWMVGVLGRG